jgi:hypothetical protein
MIIACVQTIVLCKKALFHWHTIVLEPQMGVLAMDPYLKEAIQIWCLFEVLKECRTKRGMIAAITQYLQAHVKHSLFAYLYTCLLPWTSKYISDWSSEEGQQYVMDIIHSVFVHDTDDVSSLDDTLVLETQDGEVPWHQAIEEAFGNWKKFRTSSIARKFSHLVNVIVSTGLCSAAHLKFSVGKVDLFTPMVLKRQLAASDVLEAFYEAISGFLQGGWRVFNSGEISSFFLEDDLVKEFEDAYNAIKVWHGYALAGNLLEYTDIDENEYDLRLNGAIEKGQNLYDTMSKRNVFERNYIRDRVDRLREFYVEFNQLRIRGGLRIAPFALSIFGQSGCGKSSITNLTLKAGLLYNNLSADKDRIATWADNDKFASSIRSHVNAIIFDDFANTRSDFMDFSPAYRLIQVVNNIRYLAPMADVFLKGKVSLNPYFCVVSTNVEDLNAYTYSNEPESILRRFYHVKVEPKPECCVNGILNKEKIEQLYGRTPCPDAWYISVRVYRASNSRYVNMNNLEFVVHDNIVLDRVPISVYLEWVQKASKKHFHEERQYIDIQDENPEPCTTCNFHYCQCNRRRTIDEVFYSDIRDEATPTFRIGPDSPYGVDDLDTQSGEIGRFFQRRANEFQNHFANLGTRCSVATADFCNFWHRFDILPESVICHPYVLRFGLLFWRDECKKALLLGNLSILLICMLLVLWFPRIAVFSTPLFMIIAYVYSCATIRVVENMVRRRILDLKDVVGEFTRQWQFKYALLGVGAVAIILTLIRKKFGILSVNTGLKPDSMDDIRERDERVNPWLQVETVPLPMSEPSSTTTGKNLSASMRTNLIGIVSELGKTTLGFYVTSNFLLVPTHFVEAHDEDFSVKCYKTGSGVVGSFFRDKMSKKFSYSIPNTDFTLFYVTSGGSMKDFRKFFPESTKIARVPALLVTRQIVDSSLETIPTLFQGNTRVTHTQATFDGGYYRVASGTRPGMCMSPLISDSRGSTIIGFHLGGKGSVAGCGTLTRCQIDTAVSELSLVDGVVLSASCGDLLPNMGDFPDTTMGEKILDGTDVHYKSACRFLNEGACIDVYGSTRGMSTPYSKVKETIISNAVADEFGVPQQWGPPKAKGKGVYPYQATLAHAAVPSLPIGSVLSKAVTCMKTVTKQVKNTLPELFECGPLTRVETVSGVDGKKFLDPMNFNTSPGFPLHGSKRSLLLELPEEDYPDHACPRTFTKEIWDEYDAMERRLRLGKRCYAIWKSCLKDEPTKLSKDKVRVFQSAPLALQLFVRRYFLPLVRIIQMNPLAYECAVGINAEGPEWEELWNHTMSKGNDRVLAGDYSKYDIRMPAQATLAAFDVLIDMAEECSDYSNDDVFLMRMLVNELVYPVMAYNGDLIQLFGTNPSGQNLTVIINSLVNALLLRSCFYTIYPEKCFKDECAFVTYGDDVMGTVSEICDNFNHLSYAAWLSEHDMKFTMPDKTSKPTKYMHEKDVDFLKRKCMYNADLGAKVGILDENSIFKRLHSHLESKELSPAMHAAQNIESSLHDWFYYGREVFESRRSSLRKIAEKCHIEHLCPQLDSGYDERVQVWKDKYLGQKS